MLSYPSGMSVSNRALNMLAEALRHERRTRQTRWRRLEAGQQALLVLAYLRKGDTYADLATGFGIGATTVSAISVKPWASCPPAREAWTKRSPSRRGKRSSPSTGPCCGSIGSGWPSVGIARITQENTKDTA